MEAEEDTLGLIDAALERIDEGNYGTCVQCDGADCQGPAERDSLHAGLHQVRRTAGKQRRANPALVRGAASSSIDRR